MFTLKIFFLGLIALVPSPDGKELTVLLVDGRQSQTASDHTEIGSHYPFLLARAGACQGACEQSEDIARFFFDSYGTGASERLADALGAGTAWRLSEADITLGPGFVTSQLDLRRTRRTSSPPTKLPASSLEATDFSWIADLGQNARGIGGVDPELLAPQPMSGWVVARLRLANGRVTAYRLAGVENQIVPIGFRPLAGGEPSHYSQALADSAMVEIDIEGASLQIAEASFGGGTRRSVTLTPGAGGVVELALLNMPATHAHQGSPPDPTNPLPGPGKHFELFYELARMKPVKTARAVPHADTREGIPWSSIYPRQQADSVLLHALGFDDPRTVLERVLCPIVLIPPS